MDTHDVAMNAPMKASATPTMYQTSTAISQGSSRIPFTDVWRDRRLKALKEFLSDANSVLFVKALLHECVNEGVDSRVWMGKNSHGRKPSIENAPLNNCSDRVEQANVINEGQQGEAHG